jgi:septum site-determining protein MinD
MRKLRKVTKQELKSNKGNEMKTKQGKVVTVTSGKGGVGKTTTLANLASAVADRGYKVLAMDFDIGLRNLDMILGLENRVIYDIINVLDEEASLAQAVIASKKNRNLNFLAASQTKDKNALDMDKVKKLIVELKTKYDYIFIDSPAGIEAGFEHAMVLADMALIIVNPEVSAIRDADKIIGIIDAKSEKAKNGGEVEKKLIINRLNVEMVKEGKMLDVASMHELLSIDVIGIVPEERELIAYTNKGEPIYHNKETEISHAYTRISERLTEGLSLSTEEFDILETLREGKFSKFFNKYFKIG